MRQYKGWYFLVFLFLSINVIAQHAGRTNFNKGWKFKLDSTGAYNDPTINDAGWRTLNLPHDWSIEGSFSKEHPATYNGGALPGGIAWYRKTFVLPESQKNNALFITFDGVYQN
ncbi:MAG TPA: hypothetical protein VM888_12355, partial [Chitinophagaceae bacterium]|nr:hypothetical protein [Chitinophagaceae bacterium]